MPDFNSVIHNVQDAMPLLEGGIQAMLQKYEQRLEVTKIAGVIDAHAFPGEVAFQINGYVPYEDRKHYIEYQTVITSSGKTVIAR